MSKDLTHESVDKEIDEIIQGQEKAKNAMPGSQQTSPIVQKLKDIKKKRETGQK